MVTPYGISLIGARRVGRSWGRSLRAHGWRIHAAVTRSQVTANRAVRSIGGGRPSAEINRDVFVAPIVRIAVPDSTTQQVVAQVFCYPDGLRKRVVLHTSRALGSDVFAPQAFPLNPAAKPLYHAAASMSAGQVLAIVESAIQIFASLGMRRREALGALLPLTRQVLENEERLDTRAAWTGPLARSDYQVISSHQAALRACPPEYFAAYQALNNLAARVLAGNPGGVPAALNEISHQATEKSHAKGASA